MSTKTHLALSSDSSCTQNLFNSTKGYETFIFSKTTNQKKMPDYVIKNSASWVMHIFNTLVCLRLMPSDIKVFQNLKIFWIRYSTPLRFSASFKNHCWSSTENFRLFNKHADLKKLSFRTTIKFYCFFQKLINFPMNQIPQMGSRRVARNFNRQWYHDFQRLERIQKLHVGNRRFERN